MIKPVLASSLILCVLSSGLAAARAAPVRLVAARAMLERAEGWHSGTSGDLHLDEAKRLFLKAAETGDVVARLRVATLYWVGRCGFRKDEAKGDELAAQVLADVEVLAEGGDPYAQYLVGLSYNAGIGTAQDTRRGLALLERSAAAGEVWAMWNLGWAYESGKGVEANPKVAMDWYERAAEAGHVLAMATIGSAHLGNRRGRAIDYPRARQWLERAAARGSGLAMTRLGDMHKRGYHFEKSRRAAIDWYLKAASVGEGLAMYFLAYASFNGDGLPRDQAAGVEWLRRSAETDFYYAVYEMGQLYEDGLRHGDEWVVYPNLGEATRWYQRSAELGSLEAKGWLEFQRLEGRIP